MPRLSPKIDAASLRDRVTAPDAPRLLDVRTPAEFAAAHIPGSYNVPLDTLREHRTELRESLDEVVLVCRTGGRAAQAERALAEAGMTKVHILDGGILAWQEAGAPLNRNRSRWDLERQVRLVAGVLVLIGVVGGLAVPGLEWLAAGIGAGLTVAALTDTCMMGTLLARLPFNRAPACSAETMVALLQERRSC
ncbi:rhodanese-like domain-containing protein [Actinomadura madurae]|uniref:rhodanese-like domain-containing protein n=2 Tax=Actinomadura madurae TaxID=1993 RepID=UPI002026E476|nr:rhodanese-like domain-containing protein [Actinomadura madurae]MCP9948994.1 rhodanese-like domain-containing protein [Actinomadura madurae]MCQ0010242.1 rhodanese-like domain-containing protein [Actinomadura madurae]MCQ0014445.1 rhodanese-like domain-containing protein [Actinomadura madurae]URM94596.1 rhodanese-like domain-containing protein [Actinomadura madurae]URN05305.1 rhodanese-like domain-containing protein [Actinomadura madurae]